MLSKSLIELVHAPCYENPSLTLFTVPEHAFPKVESSFLKGTLNVRLRSEEHAAKGHHVSWHIITKQD